MSPNSDFMALFYKVFGATGLIGITISFVGGVSAATNFFLGFLTIGLIIGIWHLVLHYSLGGRQPSWIVESLLAYGHYILLGGLFYAMISLFAMRWAWYCAGTTTILPGLIITTLLTDRGTKQE